MNKYVMKKAAVVFALFSFALISNAGELTIDYYWYDGNQKRKITIDSQRWVEFSATQVNISPEKQAMLEKKIGNVRIYNQAKNTAQTRSLQGFSAKASATQDGATYSEVFDGQGSMKALPGGIIVAFKPNWDEQKIKQWAKSQNLTIEKPLLKNINLWLIRSASGIASLQLANKITEQGEVSYATPNWWQSSTAK